MKAKDVLAIWFGWDFEDTLCVFMSDKANETTNHFNMSFHEFMESSLSENQIKSFGHIGKEKDGNFRYYVRIGYW